jgi:hypothetical protein
MAGMAGVGVVGRCVHDRLVVCLSRRLVLEAGAGGAGPAEVSVWTWPSSSGGGWAVASSTAWPTRIGRGHARIVRWWEPVRGEARLLRQADRHVAGESLGRSCRVLPDIKKPIGHIPLAKQNLTPRPFTRSYRTCSSPSHLRLRHLFGFSVLLSTRICHCPSCYPHRNSSRLHIRICDARLPAWCGREGRGWWRCR